MERGRKKNDKERQQRENNREDALYNRKNETEEGGWRRKNTHRADKLRKFLEQVSG